MIDLGQAKLSKKSRFFDSKSFDKVSNLASINSNDDGGFSDSNGVLDATSPGEDKFVESVEINGKFTFKFSV